MLSVYHTGFDSVHADVRVLGRIDQEGVSLEASAGISVEHAGRGKLVVQCPSLDPDGNGVLVYGPKAELILENHKYASSNGVTCV